ncbi:MAG: MTH1187 family thiamine-binding protein [Firmicutes bacterium]|nr:MTH1187 family thiamine-binding protein [Bacillota bacterium]
MAVVEAQIIPIGTENTSLSKYVADCVTVLKNYPQLKYQLTPMGTVIEGDLNEILDVVKEMHQVPFDKGAARVVTTIRVDDRRDKELTMNGKVDAVNSKLDKDSL